MRLTKKELRLMQLILLTLIGEGVVIGIHALFFPHYFYEHFFLGANWLPKLGPYNQEMTRTAGALYLGLSVPAIAALIRPVPRLLQAVGTANVFAALPHMIYHLTMANMSGAETVPQAGALALTVIAGGGLVMIARVGERRFFRQRLALAGRAFFVAPEEPRVRSARQALTRLLLGALLAEVLFIGIWTLFFPASFYASFPFGTRWVSELGLYSQHLTIDTGALCLGFASATVLALAWLPSLLVRTLGWGIAGASLAEMVYQLTQLGTSGALATAVQSGALFLTAVLGLVLVAVGRPQPQAAVGAQLVTAEPIPANPA